MTASPPRAGFFMPTVPATVCRTVPLTVLGTVHTTVDKTVSICAEYLCLRESGEGRDWNPVQP